MDNDNYRPGNYTLSGPSGDCQRCKVRPATQNWMDEQEQAHFWCLRCVTEAQLLHARKMAATIPELEQKLRDLS